MKSIPGKRILSFLRSNPCLTFSDTARSLCIPYSRVRDTALLAGIRAMDSHARKKEAIACLCRLNPGIPYHVLGKALGLKYPSISHIACGAGVNRHALRNAAATREREEGIVRSLGRGTTYLKASQENGCSRAVVRRVAKEHGVRRPGYPSLSYTRGEEARVLRWLRHPSVSYHRIALKTGLPDYTVFHIARRNGIRRKPAPFYRDGTSE